MATHYVARELGALGHDVKQVPPYLQAVISDLQRTAGPYRCAMCGRLRVGKSKARKLVKSANDDKDDSAAHSTALSPKTRQGGSRSFTRCLESACAIAASASAVAGVPRWLRAYRGRASARSCCREEPLIRRTTMHSAMLSSAYRRRLAGLARPRFGPTAQARQHRAGITRMIAHHLFDCAGTESAQPPVRQ